MRATALAWLLLAPAAVSGCLGDDGEGEQLAQPTSASIVIPRAATPRPPTVFNTSDPGYVVEGSWRMGDGWDYESNRSHLRRIRVLDQRLIDGSTKLLLETTDLSSSGTVQSVTRAWVDPRGWLVLNETDERGGQSRYTPGLPLRFWRNATTSYEHARVDATGRVLSNETVTLFSRYFAGHQTLQFPWGYVEAKRVEHLTSVRVGDGPRSESIVVHWVHEDYLNDVQFQLPDGETYKLTAARAGDFRRGQLAR